MKKNLYIISIIILLSVLVGVTQSQYCPLEIASIPDDTFKEIDGGRVARGLVFLGRVLVLGGYGNFTDEEMRFDLAKEIDVTLKALLNFQYDIAPQKIKEDIIPLINKWMVNDTSKTRTRFFFEKALYFLEDQNRDLSYNKSQIKDLLKITHDDGVKMLMAAGGGELFGTRSHTIEPCCGQHGNLWQDFWFHVDEILNKIFG